MRTFIFAFGVLCFTASGFADAETVNVEMTVKELELEIDNAGTKQSMWTFGSGRATSWISRCITIKRTVKATRWISMPRRPMCSMNLPR